MRWKTTWLLLMLAGVLFAFIYLVERHWGGTSLTVQPLPRLLSLKPTDVTSLQLRRTNQLFLRVERTNETWNMTVPLVYPAHLYKIEGLLQALNNVTVQTHIPLEELSGRNQTIADFGLDIPRATLTLQHNGRRTEILFGTKTSPGDQVYVQLLSAPGISVVSAELFDLLPRSHNDWRDNAVVPLRGLVWNRMEVRASGRGFAIQFDPTNKVFYLAKPTPARADGSKLEAMLQTIINSRVVEFVTDNQRVELEPFGLQPPEAELVFGRDTNDVLLVQFGKSPTNDPASVFVRRFGLGNIVLAPQSLLDAIRPSHTELRDPHLLSFSVAAVDAIEVVGEENFTVRRQTNDTWTVGEPQPMLADAQLIREWLNRLARLEGAVEKDVVTDFSSPYGLLPPARQYVLKSFSTNATGGLTNRILAQLDIGARREDKLFARSRRADDPSVYTIKSMDYERLPSAAWQLRDRRVWAFTTNQISRVTIRHRGYDRQLLRSANGDWTLAPGTQGVINTFAVEEAMYRLGELRAAVWVARGEEHRASYGFTEAGHKITIELKNGEKPPVLNLEFGGRASSQFPYALATVDGQTWIFEFPLALYLEVVRDLSNPLLPKTAAAP